MTLQFQTSTMAPTPIAATIAPPRNKDVVQAPKAASNTLPTAAVNASVRGK